MLHGSMEGEELRWTGRCKGHSDENAGQTANVGNMDCSWEEIDQLKSGMRTQKTPKHALTTKYILSS